MGLPTRVDASTIKLLQADLRKLTKIYQSVPTEGSDLSAWKEARAIFKKYHDNLEEWAYKVLIQHHKSEKDSSAQAKLRSTAWDLLISISSSDLFPQVWDYKSESYENSPHELRRKRESNIRKYQRRFREFIEALELLIENEGGTVERMPATEHFELAGMTILVHNLDRAERGGSSDEFLRELGRHAKRIQHAGFGDALRGLTVSLRFEENKLIAGHYNAATDELAIFSLGQAADTGTFTHEVGHRFWYRILSNQARQHWLSVVGSREVTIEASDIADYMKNFWNPDLSRTEALAKIEHLNIEPERKAKWRYLADNRPYYEGTDTAEGVDAHYLKFNLGEKTQIESISDYGDTSPIEAFAEAFRLYVTKGPRALGSWMRSFFERLVKGGKFASARRVLARYLRRTGPVCATSRAAPTHAGELAR